MRKQTHARVVESPVKQSLLLRKAGNSSQQGEPRALRDTTDAFVALPRVRASSRAYEDHDEYDGVPRSPREGREASCLLN